MTTTAKTFDRANLDVTTYTTLGRALDFERDTETLGGFVSVDAIQTDEARKLTAAIEAAGWLASFAPHADDNGTAFVYAAPKGATFTAESDARAKRCLDTIEQAITRSCEFGDTATVRAESAADYAAMIEAVTGLVDCEDTATVEGGTEAWGESDGIAWRLMIFKPAAE